MSSKHFKESPGVASDPVLGGLLKLRKASDLASGPDTVVGRAGLQPAMGIAAENAQLRAEREGGMVLLKLDPAHVGPSEFANRDSASLDPSDPELQHLKQLIQTQGQIEPIRVCPAPAESRFQYEIVVGHRRHAACALLNAEVEGGWPVLALLDATAVDRNRLVLQMHTENDAHRQLSPYEYGRMYRSWLKANLFENQSTLAAAIGRDQRSVSAYIRVAELPEVVLQAFYDRRQIAVGWIDPLNAALNTHRETVLEAAQRLTQSQPPGSALDVFRELVRAGRSRAPASTSREETVKVDGRVACRIVRRDGRITLRFGKMISRAQQKELAEEIKERLESRLGRAGRERPK